MALGIPPLACFCAATWPVLSPPLTEPARGESPKANGASLNIKANGKLNGHHATDRDARGFGRF